MIGLLAMYKNIDILVFIKKILLLFREIQKIEHKMLEELSYETFIALTSKTPTDMVNKIEYYILLRRVLERYALELGI